MPDNSTTTIQEPDNKENETETETDTSDTEVTELHYEDEVLGSLIGSTDQTEDEGKE